MSCSKPLTFRYVSCCPAKLASGKSSAVADERTATLTFSPSFSYSARTAFHTLSGRFPAVIRSRNFAAALNSFASSSPAFCSSSLINPVSAFSAINARYASDVTTKPIGTASPAEVISPRFAPFPPALGTSFFPISAKRFTYTFSLIFHTRPFMFFSVIFHSFYHL